jgi:hypothetical protein
MKRRYLWVGAGGLVALIGVVAVFWTGDGRLPKPVRDAVRKRFPNADVIEAKARTTGGKTVYAVALRHNGKRADMRLTGEGQVTRVVKEISAEDLPRAAADALAAKYPKAVFKTIDEITHIQDGGETVVSYEAVLATAGKKEVEVQVTAGGKIKAP